MSVQITTAFVQQYLGNVLMLAQQQKSRLLNTVTTQSGVIGKSTYMDQIGLTSMEQVTTRHGDSPMITVPHSRRKIDLQDFHTGDMIDQLDRVKTLINPDNSYVQAMASAAGRQIDDIIISQFFASANTGETGSTSVAFPAANQVAVNSWKYGTGTGNAGLTVSKLTEAKVILWGGEAIDENEPIYIAVTGKQMANMLATTEATSSDYAAVKALVQGEIDTFMGMKFIRTERLATDGSSYRRVPVWTKRGMGLAIGQDVKGRISERPDKAFNTYVYFSMSMGASRLEESRVVEIKCLEV